MPQVHDFPLTQLLPAVQQKGFHEQRRIFLETSSRYLSSQRQAQSKNWHTSHKIRTGTQIWSDVGVSGAGIGAGYDFGYGNFYVD
jgi:hypothetical protein